MDKKSLKILICDDSILVRKKLREHLTTAFDGTVIEAVNGLEAIEKYKECLPNLVIMDIVMPVKTGIEALTEIIKFDKKAKVVIASSTGTQTHLKTAIESGAIDFIQKPIDNDLVDKIINSITKEEK